MQQQKSVCMRLCKLSCDVTIFCCLCVHSLFPINFNHHHHRRQRHHCRHHDHCDHHCHHHRRHRCRHHHQYHHHHHHHRRRRRRFRCLRRHHYHYHCHHHHHHHHLDHHHHHHHHHHLELKLMLSEMVWKLQVNLHQLFGCFLVLQKLLWGRFCVLVYCKHFLSGHNSGGSRRMSGMGRGFVSP